jgi:hypothetical protein
VHSKRTLIVPLKNDTVIATLLSTALPDATLSKGANEPWLLAGRAPRPVLFEVVLAGLDPTTADPDHQPDQTVEDRVDEKAARSRVSAVPSLVGWLGFTYAMSPYATL